MSVKFSLTKESLLKKPGFMVFGSFGSVKDLWVIRCALR